MVLISIKFKKFKSTYRKIKQLVLQLQIKD